MKIFISADIEGVTGATHWDETDKKHSDFEEFQQQMTAEVNSACEAAIEVGATEIWIKDAHASGRNLIAAKLPELVKLIRGWSGHPYGMVQEIDETFDALFMIGYHSRAGSDANPLAHTMTGKASYIKINERYASEFLLHTYAAAMVNVPLVFITGDQGICVDATELIPGVVTMPVMKGVGNSTISIHPSLAVERIREGVKLALKKDLSRLLIQMPQFFEVEILYRAHSEAYRASFYPGAEQIDSHCIKYKATNYFDVVRMLSFVI
jgi:D-amino peptidase